MHARSKCIPSLCSKKLLIFVTLLLLVCFCHFHLLPSVIGSYNRKCYLSSKEKSDLQYLLRGVILAFQKYNVTYWLDYGTLLGAVKYQNIIPWDGDGDISTLLKDGHKFYLANEDLKAKSIRANPMIASYKTATIDIFRWTTEDRVLNGTSHKVMMKYFPRWSQDGFLHRLQHKLDSFPEEWLFPRKQLKFMDINGHVPYKTDKFLKHRYPLTLTLSVPYKWKCWLPSF